MAERTEVDFEQGRIDAAHDRRDEMLDEANRLAAEPPVVTKADARGIANFVAERRAMLADDDTPLCFGRMDLADTDETFYVGRHLLECDEFTIINWRADMARSYFQATQSDPHGLRLRRTLSLAPDDDRRVMDVKDDRYAAPPVARASHDPEIAESRHQSPAAAEEQAERATAQPPPVQTDATTEASPGRPTDLHLPEAEPPELRARDALLGELERERTGEMHSIVATIQAEQDRMIRYPLETTLVVQGGPGTGKTAVGLHRASYLLYRFGAEFDGSSILIVGPNPAFLNYIRGVLPSLGDTNVTQQTFGQLVLSSLPKATRRRVRVSHVDSWEVARLKGDSRMASLIAGAVRALAAGKNEAVMLPVGRFQVRVGAEQIAAEIDRMTRAGLPVSEVRQHLLNPRDVREPGWLVESLWAEYLSRLPAWDRGQADEKQRRDFMTSAVRDSRLTGQLDRVLPSVDPLAALQRLWTDPAFLEGTAEGILDPTEQQLLRRSPGVRRKRFAWSEHDVVLLAEAAAQVAGELGTFAHVVVDEAQDLTPMLARQIRRRCQSGSMTILGDLAQATGPTAENHSSWTDLVTHLAAGPPVIEELTLSYRVPERIMEIAQAAHRLTATATSFPKAVRPGGEVWIEEHADLAEGLKDVIELLAGEPGTVGVMVAPDQLALARRVLKRALVAFAELPGDLGDAAIGLVPVDLAKGLEFDNVIIVEPRTIVAEANGQRLLFVALTRATKRLFVVHSEALPSALGGTDPQRQPAQPPEPPEPISPVNIAPARPDEQAWLHAEIEDLRANNEVLRRHITDLHNTYVERVATAEAALRAVVDALQPVATPAVPPTELMLPTAKDIARQLHPRAYERWSAEDENELDALLSSGATPSEISEALGRQPGAIWSRLESRRR